MYFGTAAPWFDQYIPAAGHISCYGLGLFGRPFDKSTLSPSQSLPCQRKRKRKPWSLPQSKRYEVRKTHNAPLHQSPAPVRVGVPPLIPHSLHDRCQRLPRTILTLFLRSLSIPGSSPAIVSRNHLTSLVTVSLLTALSKCCGGLHPLKPRQDFRLSICQNLLHLFRHQLPLIALHSTALTPLLPLSIFDRLVIAPLNVEGSRILMSVLRQR